MDLGLKGRGVIVAASSQGIGLATAEAFAREGAQVAMCARTEKTLVEAADKLRSQTGAEIYAEALDVTDGNAVQRFTEQVAKRFGRVEYAWPMPEGRQPRISSPSPPTNGAKPSS